MTPPSRATGARDVVVDLGDVRLAGTLWLPRVDPGALVLMHPGSGPSDRHNDVHFPPIREHLLDRGLAVCSFDKRGMGGSTGDWLSSGIVDQTTDVLACLDHVSALLPGVPCGLFGHSQGGWVVIEAASRRADLAFVIANSGPGVSPAAQERHATTIRLAERADSTAEFADALRCFDLALACMSAGASFPELAARVERAGLTHVYRKPELYSFPIDHPDVWRLAAILLDHDPRRALRALRVPTLALFGADDPVVPVDASVAVYESCVDPTLLTIAVLDDGDHRLTDGDAIVDGYTATLDAFVRAALRR